MNKLFELMEKIRYFFEHELYFYSMRLFKKYYIIRRTEKGAGFFSNYYWVMGHVIFAKKLGYIPVVDMENYPTLYSEEAEINGTSNAWNYYFYDVGNISLEDAYSSRRFVLGEIRHLSKYADRYSDATYRFPSPKAVVYYSAYINRYMCIRKEILSEFEEYWHRVISDGEVIGIHIRGTDMKNDLGHPVPAELGLYTSKLKQLIIDKGVKYVYLATDEKAVIKEISETIGENVDLIYQNAFRSDKQDDAHRVGIHHQVSSDARYKHKYLLGFEVLKDAWCLSKCDYLICGMSNVTNVAVIWNNNCYKKIVCIKNECEKE